MHPGSQRHWFMYLAELGPSVLRHQYGGEVRSCPIKIFARQKTEGGRKKAAFAFTQANPLPQSWRGGGISERPD